MATSSTLIPEDVAQFIIEKIDSVAQLEALLLLRDNPQQQWDVAAVAKRLYIDDEQAGKVLARLRGALLQTDGRCLVRNCRS